MAVWKKSILDDFEGLILYCSHVSRKIKKWWRSIKYYLVITKEYAESSDSNKLSKRLKINIEQELAETLCMFVHLSPRNAYLANFLWKHMILRCEHHKKPATSNSRSRNALLKPHSTYSSTSSACITQPVCLNGFESSNNQENHTEQKSVL
jgi:hypothetical protein